MLRQKALSCLIIILLSEFLLVSSCGRCANKKSNKISVNERKLKTSLEGQCKKNYWDRLKTSFEKDRDSIDTISQHLQRLYEIQRIVSELDSSYPTLYRKVLYLKNHTTKQDKTALQFFLDFVSFLKNVPDQPINRKIEYFADFPVSFDDFDDAKLIQQIKKFLITQIDLWNNLKQQLEHKEK